MRIPILEYIFYWIYRLLKRAKHDDPSFSALLFFVLAFGGISTFIIRLLNMGDSVSGRTFVYILLIELFAFYLLFVFKKAYEKIENRYLNENQKQRRIHSILVILFFIFSGYGYYGTLQLL